MNEHKATSSNFLAACINKLTSPIPVPTETRQIPAKRPPMCVIKTAHNWPTIIKADTRNIRATWDTSLKQSDAIFKTREGAVSAIMTSPVALSVPANTSSAAETKVMNGAVRETPRIKKTIEQLGVVSWDRSFLSLAVQISGWLVSLSVSEKELLNSSSLVGTSVIILSL